MAIPGRTSYSAARSEPAGECSSSTMIVTRIAITPSLKASSLVFVMHDEGSGARISRCAAGGYDITILVASLARVSTAAVRRGAQSFIARAVRARRAPRMALRLRASGPQRNRKDDWHRGDADGN